MSTEPYKLSPQRRAQVVKALQAGNTREAAARFAGIASRTLRRWMDEGEADLEEGRETQLARFAFDVLSAEARAEVTMTSLVLKHAQEQWTAAAWWLERRRPQSWAKRDPSADAPRVEATVVIGGAAPDADDAEGAGEG